jgi:cytosine deaminase
MVVNELVEYDLVIKNARIRGRPSDRVYTIAVEGKRIAKITPENGIHGNFEIDAKGFLVVPPFFNAHFHLDSVLTLGEPRFNESGTLWEGIAIWAERKQKLTMDEMLSRVEKAVKWMAVYGTLWIRTHADTTEKTLTTVKGLVKAKELFKDLINIQVTAFPQDGILTEPENAELLEKSIELGADNVGMIPHNEHTRFDGAKSVEIAFDIAEKYNKDIDGHVDETDDPWSRNFEVVVRETFKRKYYGRVAAGHVTASHSWDPVYRNRIFGLAAKAGVSIVPNPLINIHLQGRFDNYPKRRGMAPIRIALEKGVNVALGHDCVMDPWYPLGVGDMLQVLFMAVHVDQLMGYSELKKALDLITVNGAKIWHIEREYGIEEGKNANMLILKGRDELDALRILGPPLYVIKDGALLADNTGGESKIFYKGKWERVELFL